MKLELKENYTREEADFMSIVSTAVGSNPHTFQGDSAYWDLIEVDFKERIVWFEVFNPDEPKNLYYLVAGIASVHGYKFEEAFKE